MTLLDCAVTGCAYNEDRCCCKGNIKVEGSEAVHQNETCCGSFVERGEKNCGCNVKEHESKTIDVACEAGSRRQCKTVPRFAFRWNFPLVKCV